jgi:hypothetical protein
MSMSRFPPYTGAAFCEGDVEAYLSDLAEKGWKVYSDSKPASYVIDAGDENIIKTNYQPHQHHWVVAAYMLGEPKFIKMATTFHTFKSLIASAAQSLGIELDTGPKSIRLKESTPVSNRQGLAKLAHGSTVEGIFDPYFKDKSIANLVTLVNLGLTLAAVVRVLTTTKSKSGLTEQMIASFKSEKGTNLNIRFCDSNDEHRRFFLLSSGESLVIGCSLNSFDKNEVAFVETSADDRAFFEEQWNASQPR